MTATPAFRFRTRDEILSLVTAFEACEFPHAEWDHAAHLTVAAWCLSGYPEAEATERMIKGIRRYNHANGWVPRDHHALLASSGTRGP